MKRLLILLSTHLVLLQKEHIRMDLIFNYLFRPYNGYFFSYKCESMCNVFRCGEGAVVSVVRFKLQMVVL
jgi:hypothetical protein